MDTALRRTAKTLADESESAEKRFPGDEDEEMQSVYEDDESVFDDQIVFGDVYIDPVPTEPSVDGPAKYDNSRAVNSRKFPMKVGTIGASVKSGHQAASAANAICHVTKPTTEKTTQVKQINVTGPQDSVSKIVPVKAVPAKEKIVPEKQRGVPEAQSSVNKDVSLSIKPTRQRMVPEKQHNVPGAALKPPKKEPPLKTKPKKEKMLPEKQRKVFEAHSSPNKEVPSKLKPTKEKHMQEQQHKIPGAQSLVQKKNPLKTKIYVPEVHNSSAKRVTDKSSHSVNLVSEKETAEAAEDAESDRLDELDEGEESDGEFMSVDLQQYWKFEPSLTHSRQSSSHTRMLDDDDNETSYANDISETNEERRSPAELDDAGSFSTDFVTVDEDLWDREPVGNRKKYSMVVRIPMSQKEVASGDESPSAERFSRRSSSSSHDNIDWNALCLYRDTFDIWEIASPANDDGASEGHIPSAGSSNKRTKSEVFQNPPTDEIETPVEQPDETTHKKKSNFKLISLGTCSTFSNMSERDQGSPSHDEVNSAAVPSPDRTDFTSRRRLASSRKSTRLNLCSKQNSALSNRSFSSPEWYIRALLFETSDVFGKQSPGDSYIAYA